MTHLRLALASVRAANDALESGDEAAALLALDGARAVLRRNGHGRRATDAPRGELVWPVEHVPADDTEGGAL